MILIFISTLIIPGLLHGANIPSHLSEEADRIVKRLADVHEFLGHDIADVLHERQPDAFHHINRRDLSNAVTPQHPMGFSSLRLDMKNSQDSVRLNLKKRSIVDSTTRVITHTKRGFVERASSVGEDCFATGYEEGSPDGIAAVSMCNGLHGMVKSKRGGYYIHPVERDADDGGHQVHVFKLRAIGDEVLGGQVNGDDVDGVGDYEADEHTFDSRAAPLSDAWKTETEFTIEMAVFTDAAGMKELNKYAPGREEEYTLLGVAASNAIYGDKDKVGYDAFFKVKLMEFWHEDPEEYVYTLSILKNMHTIRLYANKKFNYPKYDMHVLFTGADGEGAVSGRGFLGGVCGYSRAIASRIFGENRFATLSHEIGHNLGLRHYMNARCSEEEKASGGSFMGGGAYYNFSICNKIELQQLFEAGKGSCLFEETIEDPTSFNADQPRVLPGQNGSPDKVCQNHVGLEYRYFRPVKLSRRRVCSMLLCINANTSSIAYRHLVNVENVHGFPCADEMFCRYTCHPWTKQIYGWDLDYLRSLKKKHEWSPWSEWGDCSSTCGFGVQTRERKCLIEEGPNVSPYCEGTENKKARPCAQTPCEDEPVGFKEIRQVRGDKVCDHFLKNGVILREGGLNYRNVSKYSGACIVMCERFNKMINVWDGLFPSGTPCVNYKEHLTKDYRQRFNIEQRCVEGQCLEFSDCIDNAPKDKCGVCTNIDGYDASQCDQ